MSKLVLRLFAIVTSGLLFSGCSVNNNLTFSTQNGNCASGQTNAPYCIAVTVTNNGGGQNYISSTNYPITGLTVSAPGVSNLLTPSTNSSMDPNGCTTNNINPGSSCTFYLQLNQEANAVAINQPITVTLNYSINTNLFNSGSGTNYSSQLTVNENTNLYVVQQSGSSLAYVNVYNSSGINGLSTIESQSLPVSIAIDNNSFGYLYISTGNGLWSYGNGNGMLAPNESGTSSYNNIFTSQPSPFESGTSPTTMYGTSGGQIYSYTFSSQSWGNSTSGLSNAANNINAVSPTGVIFLVAGGQVYNCSNVSSNICGTEGVALTGTINDIGSLSIAPTGFTGLYAATNGGLFVESGTAYATTNTWSQVNLGNNQVNVVITDGFGNIYAGGNSGNLWYVSNTAPLTANVISGVSGNISSLIYDNLGGKLYVTAGSNLYSCTTSACTLLGTLGTSNVLGMAIGSSLTN